MYQKIDKIYSKDFLKANIKFKISNFEFTVKKEKLSNKYQRKKKCDYF